MEDSLTLDNLDQRMIAALQKDGRLSYEELGNRVGLSASATLRRVKRLEDSGVITGYAAQVSARRIGLGLAAYINVRMEKKTGREKRNPIDAFAAAVSTWPEVVECVSLTGEMDYLLKVMVGDMAHYERFVMETLLNHPSVQDCRTSFVMRAFKTNLSMV